MLGHTGSGGGFAAALVSFPDDHLTIAVLVNTEVGAPPALRLAAAIARPLLGLPETHPLRDLPVPAAELAALPGTYDSDEGAVELFARDGRLHYRISGQEGVLRRQSENVYALNEDTEVRFVPRGARAMWTSVYTGGLLMDPKRRVR
jgi:hypothetical protein